MSNVEQKQNMVQIVHTVEPEFKKLAAIHGAVDWEREASFALQILKANDYLMSTAVGDPDSLKQAIINVAAIGLSLSPVHKHAYLVPRGKKVCLDISYRGYIQLAVDMKAIKWAKADLVYEKDTFRVIGTNKEPVHEFSPFGDRGEPIGVYSLAKTHDGEFLFDFMSAAQVVSIRDRSESYKSFVAKKASSTPWDTDFEEMVKKTMLKRASKSWPMTDTRESTRFATAIDVTNDINFEAPAVAAVESPQLENKRAESLTNLRALLKELGREEQSFMEYAERIFKRKLMTLEDLTDLEVSQSATSITQMIAAVKKKEAKNENAS